MYTSGQIRLIDLSFLGGLSLFLLSKLLGRLLTVGFFLVVTLALVVLLKRHLVYDAKYEEENL